MRPKKASLLTWEFLHGKGHEFYRSTEAKRIYGLQLVSLGEKLIWFIFAPLLGYFFSPHEIDIATLLVGVTVMVCAALYLRHQGLLIIDQIETEEIEVDTPTDSNG